MKKLLLLAATTLSLVAVFVYVPNLDETNQPVAFRGSGRLDPPAEV